MADDGGAAAFHEQLRIFKIEAERARRMFLWDIRRRTTATLASDKEIIARSRETIADGRKALIAAGKLLPHPR